MTGFMDLVRARRSVRAYSPQPVARELLDELAEALRLAPSASNQQPWKLVFVDDPELKDEVARATFGPAPGFNRFAPTAPVIAVLAIERPRAINRLGALVKRREFPLIDIGIGAAHLALRAAELGLGTCLLGWFDEGRIKRLIGMPRRGRIGLVATIGFPANSGPPRGKTRKSIEEIRAYNRY